MNRQRTLVITSLLLIVALVTAVAGTHAAGETPRRGGILLAAIAADAPSLDPHQEQTFATIEIVAPCYSTLVLVNKSVRLYAD